MAACPVEPSRTLTLVSKLTKSREGPIPDSGIETQVNFTNPQTPPNAHGAACDLTS